MPDDPKAAPEKKRERKIAFDAPSTRPLRVYAFDPSNVALLGNRMQMEVRFEDLDPGPVVHDMFAWDGVAVIDYDATNHCYYQPVDLDDPQILVRGGLEPNESDPRFHQQMVYAVVTETVQNFEAALGRRIHWRRGAPDESIFTLNLFPHAMVAANAFYSPQAHGILFGYFRAHADDQGRNLPNQTVFTCLSHDIIVHETTHAIIDGIRSHFSEQTNPDVAAFHEGFADLAALFRHFSHQEVLLDAIERTGGMLYLPEVAGDGSLPAGRKASVSALKRKQNPLIGLAQQFGEATGRGQALRSALDKEPDPKLLQTVFEPHQRGSILVAAVFDAYFSVYLRRTADLFHIFRAGGGSLGADLPASLSRMLAAEASKTADLFFRVCVRALDYSPPVDITFGDFLRAVITSDFDVHPSDETGLRDAFMEAFRARGIFPDGASSFSDTAMAWPKAKALPPIPNLDFGDPSGLTRRQQNNCKKALTAFFADKRNRIALGFDPAMPVEVPSFHPVFRIAEDGGLRTEMVIEAVQSRQAQFDERHPQLGGFPLRGGATLIAGKSTLVEARREDYAKNEGYVPHGNIRYVIGKQLHGDSGMAREKRQRINYERLGLAAGEGNDRFNVNFALLHGGF